MLNRDEYNQLIQDFFVVLNGICLYTGEKDLRALPGFAALMDEYVPEFRDLEQDASSLLYHSFSYLDEFINADWGNVSEKGYDAYKHRQMKNPDQQ